MTEPEIIGGRYEVGEMLGRGGMAEVRRGRDLRLGRPVAVKRLRTDLASDATFQARFRREAQSAASLNHPTIVSVYDTGDEVVGEQRVPYIVMEYVEGQTLRDVIRSGEPLLPERSLEIISGVLQALAYSHHAGIVHRDIKPANVMLTTNGQVKVMDFGIARAVSDASATMTQTAAVIGTAQYLSPEQARGSQVDARSDLYSTGCLLYELLTGRPPFVGDSPVSVAYQHVRENPSLPSSIVPGLSPAIDAIVMRALQKDPDTRYQSAEEMRADVERAVRGEQVAAAATQVATGTAIVPAVVPASVVGYASPSEVMPAVQEEPEEERTGRGTIWAIGILSAILVAALIFIGIQVFGSDEPDGPLTATVPRLTGLTVEQAEDELARMTPLEGETAPPFTLAECTAEPSDTVPVDQISSQDPEANAVAENGTAIQCVVSTGLAETTVPRLVGLSLEDATATLEAANLEVGQVTPQDGTAPKDQVLAANPEPGTAIQEGSEVDLTIASGQNVVPSLLTMTQADAETAIRAAGFTVGDVTPQESNELAGTVIDQDPAPNVAVDLGSAVSITVAVAPPPETTPVPDVSGGDLTYDQAESVLNDAGFTDVSIDTQASDPGCRQDPGDNCFVIEQDPAAGEEFEDPAGTPVTLILRQAEGEGDQRVVGSVAIGTAVLVLPLLAVLRRLGHR